MGKSESGRERREKEILCKIHANNCMSKIWFNIFDAERKRKKNWIQTRSLSMNLEQTKSDENFWSSLLTWNVENILACCCWHHRHRFYHRLGRKSSVESTLLSDFTVHCAFRLPFLSSFCATAFAYNRLLFHSGSILVLFPQTLYVNRNIERNDLCTIFFVLLHCLSLSRSLSLGNKSEKYAKISYSRYIRWKTIFYIAPHTWKRTVNNKNTTNWTYRIHISDGIFNDFVKIAFAIHCIFQQESFAFHMHPFIMDHPNGFVYLLLFFFFASSFI